MRERKAKPKAKKGNKKAAGRQTQSCSGRGGFMISVIALAGGAYYFRPTRTPTITKQETPAIVVGVVEEHHHVLPYYAREVAKNTLPVDGKATILHLDSHADMGVPRAYLKADAHMERYSAINDFMITAALTGVAERISLDDSFDEIGLVSVGLPVLVGLINASEPMAVISAQEIAHCQNLRGVVDVIERKRMQAQNSTGVGRFDRG